MARVLSLSSQTVYGPVGNSASVPALQACGHEVLQVPTVLLSNHPGHGKPAGQATPATVMQHMLEAVQNLGALAGCAAVMTGYFATPEQVKLAAETIAAMKRNTPALMVLVDPVLGDGTALYVPQAVAEAIRDHLLPLATITTPNLFELSWLTSNAVEELDVAAAVAALGTAETIVTSVPHPPQQLATLLFSPEGLQQHVTPHLPHVPHGTGDHLAGLYLAERLLQPAATAFATATAKLDRAIAKSAGSNVLQVN